MSADLARIAAALERMAPPPAVSADPRAHAAYLWTGEALSAARDFAPVPLDLLGGMDAQKATLVANSRRLAAGHAAHDALLWGARGTGKSALVKAAVGAVRAEGGDLALVAVGGDRLARLPALFDRLATIPRAFVLFVDDLGFDGPEAAAGARALRSLLDGGVEARPANTRLYVTANRRHILPRDATEQAGALAPRDAADDALALADRFGLSLGFHVLDQPTYLAIVAGYAAAYDLPFEAADAVQFATQRGARSGRVAWHYVTELAGRHGIALSAFGRTKET